MPKAKSDMKIPTHAIKKKVQKAEKKRVEKEVEVVVQERKKR